MPFGIMEQRDASTLSGLFKENHYLSEEKTSFRKPKNVPDQHDAQPHYADPAASHNVETTEEIEVQGIRNLLPDEDDLFSGIIDKLGIGTHSDGSDGEEEFDLFHSGGGMELELDNCLNSLQDRSNYKNGSFNGARNINGSISSRHLNASGVHPCRTLFVRNISSSLEDSELRALFEQYGDIQTLYTACKHRGFVIVSYYDIRAAWNAMRSLQNKPLRHRNLDIHYSIPKDDSSERERKLGTLVILELDSSISNEDLYQIFGSFGEIKEIGKTLQCNKFIEYYDIRAADAAFRALNRTSIAGKQIKLEFSQPSGDRLRLMQQFYPLIIQDEHIRSRRPNGNSSSEEIAAFLATRSPASMTRSFMHSGSFRGLHASNQLPVGAFNENSVPQGSFSVPNSYPLRAPTSNQFGLREPIYTLNQAMSGSQGTPSDHLHSLPEYCEGTANEIPYSPFSTVADLALDGGPRVLEGINDRHMYAVDSNGQQEEHQVGAFGSSWTSGCRLDGHHVLGNSNSFHQLSTSPLFWPNSSPYVNGINAHCTPKLRGISTSSRHVLNTVLQTQQCHDGLAPAVNMSRCGREHSYMGESSEGMGFNMESIRRVGYHNRSPDLAYHNLLHDGNRVDPFWNSGLSSPQRACYNFPRVDLAASAPTSFGTPKERMRNLSNCRSETDSCHADRIKYELDINRVLRREDSRTTLMIKNIPNKYTAKMLLATIDEQHRGTYDFIYLPIDFKNKCNMGYAFINMIDPLQIVPFYKTFNGRKWEKFNSGKVASIAYARIQGKAALVAHFQNSSLMNEDKRCRPILFCTDGPNAGDQEPFPLGASIRSRSNKARSNYNEEGYNQATSSSSVRGDAVSSGTNSVAGSVKDCDLEQTTNPSH